MVLRWLVLVRMVVLVTANNNNDVCLLILEDQKSILPVAISAFDVSQSSKKELSSYHGAIVVTHDGNVRVIRGIDILGFWGETFGRKIISALFGAHRIKVHFESCTSLSLERFKSVILEYIPLDSMKGDPYLPQDKPLELVLEQVKQSNSFEEIFKCINVPQVEDCLDVL
ncbi:hypothetical protein [Rheinheimera baltica]|uniref:hypothetical protein n=1 Tax=Rheinheimera baltica TaxID=67576 RepID=UPI00273F6A37|nr:hypothetical protein [Rheinheimera baltica]MDP5190051.1 hypothetical protein [Rheinheimera baltica]